MLKEAKGLAKELTHVKFDGIITSDLDRAEHTAKLISDETGKPIWQATRGLRPWHVGTMAGKPIKNCLQILHDYIENKPDTPLPGGESFNDFKARAMNFLAEVARKYDGRTVALVTHHRFERLVDAVQRAGGDLDADAPIDADAFMEPGIAPAEYCRQVIESTESDGDEDEETETDDVRPAAKPAPRRAPKPKKPSQPSRPSVPWSSKPIEPRRDGPGKGLWSRSVGGALDGTGIKSDPFDLKPAVPLRKRSQSWQATVRGSLLET